MSATRRLIVPAIAAVGLVVVLVSIVVAGGSYAPSEAGLPDPGPLVGWGLPVLRLATDASAIVTIGALLSAAFLSPMGKDGLVSPLGRRDLVRAGWAAVAWSVLATMQALFTVSEVLGIPLGEAISPSVLSTYANDIPITRALLLTALGCLSVALVAAATTTVGAAAIWMVVAVVIACLPQLAGHGAALGDHALATSSGLGHVAAATMWIGGLSALAIHAFRGVPLARSAQRFGVLGIVCVVLLGATGLANAYTRLDEPSQLLTTGYGQVVLAKALILVALVLIAAVVRRRIVPTLDGSRFAFARIAGLELVVMTAAVATGVGLSLSPTPRIEVPFPTPAENLLGFAFPPPPDVAGVVLGFRLEPLLFTGALVAAALYCFGVARLRARGDHWSWGRTISWLLGISLFIWATNAGIATYAMLSVGIHMIQHMTLSMLAPILLVLGAPFTLALRALRPSPDGMRGPREWIVWLLHSPFTKIVTNPLVVFALYAVGLYGLYLTPAFGWLMGNHIGHLWMQVHFLVVGYLFAWIILGVDPLPKPLPYWARFGFLLIAIAFHTFFAVVIMLGDVALGESWYSLVRPPWIDDPVADTHLGGQIAWAISELPMFFMLIILGVQWGNSDAREARRKDRAADRDGDAELKAYNDYLRSLEDRSPQ